MGIEHHKDTPLARAVRAERSQSAFGRLVGRRQSTINDWLKNDVPLPAELCPIVEEATGIPREDLRPDLFQRDAAAERSSQVPAR